LTGGLRCRQSVGLPTADIFQSETADLLTEASNRASDQPHHLTRLLSRVGTGDRAMLVEMVEKLAARLSSRPGDTGRH